MFKQTHPGRLTFSLCVFVRVHLLVGLLSLQMFLKTEETSVNEDRGRFGLIGSDVPSPTANSPPSPSSGPVDLSPASCGTARGDKMEGPSGVKTKRSDLLNSKVHETQAAHRLGEVQFVQFQHCLENIMNIVSPFRITALRHPPRCLTQLFSGGEDVTLRIVATTSLSFSLQRSFWTQKSSCCSSCLSAGRRSDERNLGNNWHSLYLSDR